jgi:hypothetical protein
LLRQLVAAAESLDETILSMGRMLTTRWVASSHRAVKAVLNNFNSLYDHFRKASGDRQLAASTRNEMMGMMRILSSRTFVENLLLLSDALAELSILSQVFQRDSVTMKQAQDHIAWVIDALKRRKEKARELYTLTSETFKSVPITDGRSHKAIPKEQFLQALIDRLQQRLIVSADNKALCDQINVLDSSNWPSDVSPPWLEGEILITELCKRFNLNISDVISQFREYMKSSKVQGGIELLLQIELIIPISSAEAERGFSQMNLIVTDTRSRLLVSNVSDLMFIRLNGPPPSLWDPSSARKRWLNQRHRPADDNRSKTVKTPVVNSHVAKMFVI